MLPNSDHVTCHEAEERESSFELSLKSICEQNFRPFRKSEIVSQSCLTLSNPMDCSPPGPSVHGILQARILEWVANPSPGYLPDPGIKPGPLALQEGSLLPEPPEEPRPFRDHKQFGCL